MIELHADMAVDGNGWRGRVEGHSVPVTWLVARLVGGDRLRLELLWQPPEDCAPIPVGDGIANREFGEWRGMVSEFLGSWVLRGDVPGRLLLWERT